MAPAFDDDGPHKIMVTIAVYTWQGGQPMPEKTKRRAATVEAFTLEDAKREAHWAITSAMRALDLAADDDLLDEAAP